MNYQRLLIKQHHMQIDCNLLLNKGGNFQYQFSIFTKLNVYINTDLFTKKIHDKNCQTQLF